MRIYLVRHGEAAAAWGEDPDPGLSELGQTQANEAASSLQRLISREVNLLSSPLLRAQETATPLAKALDLPVGIVDIYREVPAPVPFEQRQAWLQGFMRGQWSEQESSLLDWRQAIIAGLMSLPGDTVIFTHFLVLNAVVSSIQSQDKVVSYVPDNASITVLERSEDGLRLVALGREMETHIN